MNKAAVVKALAAAAALVALSGAMPGNPALAQPRMAQPTEMRMPPAAMVPGPALPPPGQSWAPRSPWHYEGAPYQPARRMVGAGELMSYHERFEFQAKLRETRSPAERYELKAKKYAELEKRAAEHGLMLRESTPGMAAAEAPYREARPADPRRWEGGWTPEPAARWQAPHAAAHPAPMHIQPPMGR